MKKTSLFLLGAMTLGLAACSSEEPSVNNNDVVASGGDLYTTLTLDFNTRSTTTGEGTSSDGVEVGTLSENNVDEILVVLAKRENNDYTYVTHALASSIRNNNVGTDAHPTYVVRFETQDLYPYAGGTEYSAAQKDVKGDILYIFTYCNPTQTMKSQFPARGDNDPSYVAPDFNTLKDAFYTIDRSTSAPEFIWDDNTFLMTNVNVQTANQLPSKWELLNTYNKETTPFNLGTVNVQRTATRFDFAQKEADETDAKIGVNQYVVTNPVTGTKDAIITMDAMAFFNEAKNFYGFMHTSADGSATDWTLCGKDNIGSYVVSPYYTFTTAQRTGKNFNYSMTDDSGKLIAPESTQYNYVSIASLANGREDNWNGNSRDYRFWRYATPNTIPGGIDNQIKGNTTGVLFRATMSAYDENGDLAKAMTAGDILYAFEGILFGNKEMLAAYVNTHPKSAVQEAFVKCFDFTAPTEGDLLIDLEKAITPKAGVNAAKVGGFNLYRPTTVDGKNVYYCYYYYYNRHNDNGNPGVMGIMEFAAVRNNVYKLYVDTVLQYGHPGNPDDDFEPEDPEDPDETPQTYFKVSVEVLPWVVRVNDINF